MFKRLEKADAEPSQAHPPATGVGQNHRRPFLIRLFSVKFWGAVRLTVICVVVGIFINVFRTAQNPASFDLMGAIAEIWQNAFGLTLWIIQNGWQPALIGATVVLPIWIVWRLLTFPFRR